MSQKKDIKKIIKQVEKEENFEILPSGKIRCKITNHEMLPVQFEEYFNGKSYKRSLEKIFDASCYLPHIVQHKKEENFLFCKLTGNKIAKKKSVVEKHINGKAYKAKLKAFLEEEEKKKQAKLIRKAKNIDSNDEEGQSGEEDEGFMIDQMIAGFEKEEKKSKKRNKLLAKVAGGPGKKGAQPEDDLNEEEDGDSGSAPEDDEVVDVESEDLGEEDEGSDEESKFDDDDDDEEDDHEAKNKAKKAKSLEKGGKPAGFKIDGKKRKPQAEKIARNKKKQGSGDEEEEIEFIRKKVSHNVSKKSKKIKKVAQKLGKKPQPKEI